MRTLPGPKPAAGTHALRPGRGCLEPPSPLSSKSSSWTAQCCNCSSVRGCALAVRGRPGEMWARAETMAETQTDHGRSGRRATRRAAPPRPPPHPARKPGQRSDTRPRALLPVPRARAGCAQNIQLVSASDRARAIALRQPYNTLRSVVTPETLSPTQRAFKDICAPAIISNAAGHLSWHSRSLADVRCQKSSQGVPRRTVTYYGVVVTGEKHTGDWPITGVFFP